MNESLYFILTTTQFVWVKNVRPINPKVSHRRLIYNIIIITAIITSYRVREWRPLIQVYEILMTNNAP